MDKSTLDRCRLFSGAPALMVPLMMLLMAFAVNAEIRFIDTEISGGHPRLTISNTVPGIVGAIERSDSPTGTNWVTAMTLSTVYTNWTDDSVVAGAWDTLVYRGRELPSARLGGRAWEDLDGNGRRDAGEPGWDGVQVSLSGTDSFGNPVSLSKTTAGGGVYEFSSLESGTYAVRFDAPPGSSFTVQHSPDADESTDSDADPGTGLTGPLSIGKAEHRTAVDAGLIVPGSIHGYAFDDLNGNGEDEDEPRQSGVTVELQGDVDGDGSSDSLTTVTDGSGEYGFTALHPGSYSVTLTPPAGAVATGPTTFQVTVQSRQELVAEAGQARIPQGDPRVEVLVEPALVFGVAYLGSVHGYVFDDQNADGADDSDPRETGVTVELTGTDGQGDPVSGMSVSDANGEYHFTGLLPGDYTVTMTPPAGAVPVLPVSYQVTVQSRQELVAEAGQSGIGGAGDPRVEVQVGPTLVFGITFLGSVHGYAFNDLMPNGRDDGEPRFPGVTITLRGDADGDGVSDTLTTVTDANGEYGFVLLYPGQYVIDEVAPGNPLPTTPTTHNVTVLSRQELVAEAGQAGIVDPGDPRVEVLLPPPQLLFGYLVF